jgi:Zn-dependent metalloprotease
MSRSRTPGRRGGFSAFSLHATEKTGKTALKSLKSERRSLHAFALTSAQPENLDPESAAKTILRQALASEAVPALAAPKVDNKDSDFKSLGVETVPLTDTKIVKFRQQIDDIPVYGSLVSVELDNQNQCVSINSNLAKPEVKSHVAKLSPAEALHVAGKAAGYGTALPDATPALNFYLDGKGNWHLAYIVEDVRLKTTRDTKRRSVQEKSEAMHFAGQPPQVHDYVVDALSGKLVATLPRTPTARATGKSEAPKRPRPAPAKRARPAFVRGPSRQARRTSTAPSAAPPVGSTTGVDELDATRRFGVVPKGSGYVMRDATLNISTFDFNWRDPVVQNTVLPGTQCASPPVWSKAAVSAHANAAAVASYLRDVLKRNNIDNKGGAIVSSVNCIYKRYEQPPGSKRWLNAFWTPDENQMVYGQDLWKGKLRSIACALDVVAHELCHGITNATSRLEYLNESGALNESYSDIFGVIVANHGNSNIGSWRWLIGADIADGVKALRDFEDPTRYGQPKLMRNYVHTSDDSGGVHTNSGIHNFAAYNVITAKDGSGKYLFKPDEAAAIFHLTLTQQLSRASGFADSLRGALVSTRSLFRALPPAALEARVRAVEAGFKAAGIT